MNFHDSKFASKRKTQVRDDMKDRSLSQKMTAARDSSVLDENRPVNPWKRRDEDLKPARPASVEEKPVPERSTSGSTILDPTTARLRDAAHASIRERQNPARMQVPDLELHADEIQAVLQAWIQRAMQQGFYASQQNVSNVLNFTQRMVETQQPNWRYSIACFQAAYEYLAKPEHVPPFFEKEKQLRGVAAFGRACQVAEPYEAPVVESEPERTGNKPLYIRTSEEQQAERDEAKKLPF